MQNPKEKIKNIQSSAADIWAALNQNLYQGKSYEENARPLRACCYCFAAVMLFFVIYNNSDEFRLAQFVCAGICVSCLVAALLFTREKTWKAGGIFLTVMSSAALTLFAIKGTNNGFAILWSIFIPTVLMSFISVLYGLAESIYLELLFIALFHTPLRGMMMVGKYSDTFMNRYPILYGTFVLVVGIAMVNYHRASLKQLEYEQQILEKAESLKHKSQETKEKYVRLSFEMIKTLINAIDAKDQYTHGHSERVARYSLMLADKMKLEPEKLDNIYIAALLHDIGKIGVSDTIINKDGKLTADEYDNIKQHPVLGSQILTNISEMPVAVIGAKYHHERYDGTGYPEGLKGEEIPLEARIISVADAYDAMTSNRSYRNSMTQEKVREQLVNGRGRQFDPEIVDQMLIIMDGDKEFKMREM
ncbi:MAG: HD-GYP domain-containing protein [Pseudobutyrivibrio sp.]|nr:HD-GYP domain-containing protein [Pseudobutyrivibrio sp.]